MAHRLDPIEGESYLSPLEVVRRLEGEFGFVESDTEAGAEHVAAMIRQFERMAVPAAVIEEHRQLLPFAIRVVIADSSDFTEAYLSFVAMPGQGLFIGYHSARHEESAAPLLDRCRQALGYQVMEI